jgi:hypothetical protein
MARTELVEFKRLIQNINDLENLAKTENREKLIAKIKEIVPEYKV